MTTEISTIAVLGAGTMGRGIAHVAALGGFHTRLFDSHAAALTAARERIVTDYSTRRRAEQIVNSLG